MVKKSPFLLLIILILTGCSPIQLQNPTPTVGVIYASMTAEMGGELSIENECIRVGNHTLVWPADFSVQVENNSVSVTSGLVTGRRKQDTFRDGELVQSGGGIVETRDALDDTIYNAQFNEHLEESVPAHCPAPFWVVGSIDHYPSTGPTSLTPVDLSKPIPFPLQDKPDGERAVMEALASGTLIFVNNCIRISGPQGTSHMLIWPPDYSLKTENGTVEIINEAGEVVAKVGDRVQIGGGEVWSLPLLASSIQEQIPSQCTAPYWIVGDVVP